MKYYLEDADVLALRELLKQWPETWAAVQKVQRLRGNGITNTKLGLTLSIPLLPQPKRAAPQPSIEGFTPLFARVEEYTQDGSNKRWIYGVIEIEKSAIGYDGWTDVPDGLETIAYNSVEDQNGAVGLWGNGVNSSNLVGSGLTIQPVPVGTPVALFEVTFIVGESTVTEYWFCVVNGTDGSCLG